MLDTDNSKEEFYYILSQADLGRIYLKSAVEKGQEHVIVSALHNLIDAILWDISKQEQKQKN